MVAKSLIYCLLLWSTVLAPGSGSVRPATGTDNWLRCAVQYYADHITLVCIDVKDRMATWYHDIAPLISKLESYGIVEVFERSQPKFSLGATPSPSTAMLGFRFATMGHNFVSVAKEHGMEAVYKGTFTLKTGEPILVPPFWAAIAMCINMVNAIVCPWILGLTQHVFRLAALCGSCSQPCLSPRLCCCPSARWGPSPLQMDPYSGWGRRQVPHETRWSFPMCLQSWATRG